MGDSYMNNIVDDFTKNLKDFRNKGIIQNSDLKKHAETDLHSWLEYLMIKSGEQNGLLTIPEIKLRFTKPINPMDYGVSKRRRWHSKVDIAFYDYGKIFLGFSEIYTMDEAHGALPTKRLAEAGHFWLTPRDSLLHAIQYASLKASFIILVVILLRRASYITWNTQITEIDSELKRDKNYYAVFVPYWKAFRDKINIDNTLLIINEDGIEKL